MSSFNPAYGGGLGYDHGSKRNCSPANPFELRPTFGQSGNHYRCDSGGFSGGIPVPAYGQSSNHSYPFGYATASGGTSMSPFNSTNSGTSAPAFAHNTHPFGFTPSYGGISMPTLGQNSATPFGFTPNNGGTCVPTLGHNSSTPFGSAPAPANGGTSMPTFGQNSATPFGFAPINGGTCVPTFGHNSSTPFGSSPAPAYGGTSMPTFGQNSATSFGFNPSNGGTNMSTFGQNSATIGSAPANGGTSMPTFGRNSATSLGFNPSNGGTNMSTFGQNSATLGSSHANGGTSVPTFGQSNTPFGCAPANGGTSVPLFGRSTNSFGFTPSVAITSVPAWQRSNPLGPVTANGGTPATTFGEGRSYFSPAPTDGATFASAPTNGATSVPGCGTPLFSTLTQAAPLSPICGSLSGSTSCLQTLAVNPSNSPGFSFGCTTPCSQPTLPSGTSSLFGTDPYLFGTQNHLSGSTTHFQTPTINASSFPGFGFGCTTSGQTTTQFGTISNLNETNTCSGEIQSPFSCCQVKTPLFGDSSSGPLTFRVSHGGSRATPYTETVELEPYSRQSTRFMSISAMPVFRDKCHEELRWEDKQLGDNGNIPLFHGVRSGQSAIGSQLIGSKVKPYSKILVGEDGSRATSISAMPVYQDKSHEELRWEDHQFNNAGGRVDLDLAQLNCFRNPVSKTGSSFQNAMPSVPPNIFASRPPSFTFPTCSTPFTSNPFLNDSRGGTYTSITQPPSIFGPTITFSHPNPSIISASASEASTSGPSFFNYISSAPCTSICSTSVTTPVTASVPYNTMCSFSSHQSTLDDVSPSRCRDETPPSIPQMSAEGPKTTSVRYGISSIPVNHLANEKQNLLLPPNCNRKGDGPKVAFSTDARETTTARTKVPLPPKDNSGFLISGPSEEWTLKIDFEDISHIKHTSIHVYENGKVSVELSKPLADGFMYQDKVGNPGETFAAENSVRTDSVNGNHPSEKEVSSNVNGLMPKLKHSDYFIEPRVEELAIKESFEPGFCSHVKDFVVGHQRYGRIKFLGETDVRQLDVNSHIVFRNREVIISLDENKKPPVGRGLNKPAEITLCNIKCIDKAGNQHINGPKVDKYKKKLMKKAAEQGAEFVSYDPVQGEWKFRVEHF